MRYDREGRAELAKDVAYELRMLAGGADRIWQHMRRQVSYDSVVSNSVTEAWLVHARLLDDFLGATSRGPRNRDVLATDFNPNWAPRRVLTDHERADISGKVAHLADDRVEGFQWSVSDILVRFVDTFTVFVNGHDECEQLFGGALAEAQAVVQPFTLAARIRAD
jgi:hypothetical protein